MKTPERLDLTPAELDALLERVRASTLAGGDYETIKAMVETLTFLTRALDDKAVSIKRLLRLLFGQRTEKSELLLPKTPDTDHQASTSKASKRQRKGHGTRRSGCGSIKPTASP